MYWLLEVSDVSVAASHFPVTAVSVLIIGFVAAATLGSLAWFQSKRPLGWRDDKSQRELQEGPHAADAGYDRELVPAETAARQSREAATYKETPESGDGYTVDREGLLNNYAVEPEMYVNEPGDLRNKNVAEEKQRKAELADINQTDEEGNLSMAEDDRGKGVGVI